MKTNNESGLASLVDFSLKRLGTPVLAQYAYMLAFVYCLLQAVFGMAFGFSFIQTAVGNAGLQFIIGLFMVVMSIGAALFELVVVRLVLEFLVVQFEGKTDPTPVFSHYASSDDLSSKPEPVKPKIVPQLAEGEWRCRCGTANPEGTAFCTNCKRAPNAIF